MVQCQCSVTFGQLKVSRNSFYPQLNQLYRIRSLFLSYASNCQTLLSLFFSYPAGFLSAKDTYERRGRLLSLQIDFRSLQTIVLHHGGNNPGNIQWHQFGEGPKDLAKLPTRWEDDREEDELPGRVWGNTIRKSKKSFFFFRNISKITHFSPDS